MNYLLLEVGKVYEVSGSSGMVGGDFLMNGDKIKIVEKCGDIYCVEVYAWDLEEWSEYEAPAEEIFNLNLVFTEEVTK